MSSDLVKLLQETFKIDIPKGNTQGKEKRKKQRAKQQEEPFLPQRFPSFFKLARSGSEEKPAAKIPLGSTRSVAFLTDAEDQYFDRTHEPGDLKIWLVSFKPNATSGGHAQGEPKQLSDLMNVSRSSPQRGRIRIIMNPTDQVAVDDRVQMKAILDGPSGEFEERFWVQIVDKENPPQTAKKDEDVRPDSLGLPQFRLVHEKQREGRFTWEQVGESTGQEMDHSTIMHPLLNGDRLEAIYINMDSNVLKSYKARVRSMSEEQIELADKRYVSSVYFHTLFLYTIARNRGYDVRKGDDDVGIDDFLKDVFSTYYSEFLLNFGMNEPMASLDL